MPWSIVVALGFSAAQTSMTGCPGWIETGCAVNVTIRAGGATRAAAPPALPAGAGVGAGACPAADQINIPASRRLDVIGLRMCVIIPKREVTWVNDWIDD